MLGTVWQTRFLEVGGGDLVDKVAEFSGDGIKLFPFEK